MLCCMVPAFALITEDYNSNDAAKLRAFFELTNSMDYTNGYVINGSSYDPDDPSTWRCCTWNSAGRLTAISFNNLSVVGDLDLSYCSELLTVTAYSCRLTGLNVTGCPKVTRIEADHNKITALDVTGCPVLRKLYCDRNSLTSLDVSNNKDLTLLSCYSNQLTNLDVSNNAALELLFCYSNMLTQLDLSNNSALTDLTCWNENLEKVVLNPATERLSIFLTYSDSSWTFRDINGTRIGTDAARYIYNSNSSVSLPVYATNSDGSQTIVLTASGLQLTAPRPRVLASAAEIPYDIVYNGAVDVNDFVLFASAFGGNLETTPPESAQFMNTLLSDFDGNGIVDVQDFIVFAANYGKNQSAPQMSEQWSNPDAQPAAAVNQEEFAELNRVELVEDKDSSDQPIQLDAAPQNPETVETFVTIQEHAPAVLIPATPAQEESVQTLCQAHSSALLDLYDNQNDSVTPEPLSAKAVDESIAFDDDSFDFLFDESDRDADDNSDVDLSAVLDELELELI